MRVEERWEGCREQDVLENSPSPKAQNTAKELTGK